MRCTYCPEDSVPCALCEVASRQAAFILHGGSPWVPCAFNECNSAHSLTFESREWSTPTEYRPLLHADSLPLFYMVATV